MFLFCFALNFYVNIMLLTIVLKIKYSIGKPQKSVFFFNGQAIKRGWVGRVKGPAIMKTDFLVHKAFKLQPVRI